MGGGGMEGDRGQLPNLGVRPRRTAISAAGRAVCAAAIVLPVLPKTQNRASVHVKAKKPTLHFFKHLHPPTPVKRTKENGPACYNANGKGGDRSGTPKADTPDVAHVSRRAVSPFVATCLYSPGFPPVGAASALPSASQNLMKTAPFVRESDIYPTRRPLLKSLKKTL